MEQIEIGTFSTMVSMEGSSYYFIKCGSIQVEPGFMKNHDNEFVFCHNLCSEGELGLGWLGRAQGFCVRGSLKPLKSEGLFYVTGNVCATS